MVAIVWTGTLSGIVTLVDEFMAETFKESQSRSIDSKSHVSNVALPVSNVFNKEFSTTFGVVLSDANCGNVVFEFDNFLSALIVVNALMILC